MFLRRGLRRDCCSKYDCLFKLATPFTKLRRVSRVVEEISPRIYPHDAARQNLGVIEERFERRLGGQGADRARAWRIVDRVIRDDKRSSPAWRLVRRRGVQQIRMRE